MRFFQRLSTFLTLSFPLWALLFAVIGYNQPTAFAFVLPHLSLALGLIMFGMGATLTVEDLRRVAQRPREVALGVAAQFTIMPLLAYGIARGLGFEPDLAIGFLLLGCCPGGTASNVIAYLARADVALSVSMTTVATLCAPLLTPLIIWALGGHWMQIDGGALFLSIVQIVVAPVALGLLARRFAAPLMARLTLVLPLFSVAIIVLVVGAVVGKAADAIHAVGLLVLLGVALHNGLGLAFGYLTGRLGKLGPAQRRALAIEVGMQNSGLATALAVAHFSPAAAVPAALFSAWHNLSGPALAAWWSRRPSDPPPA
ncbi:MAG: bile acid:sodium symporter family protein [Verrucomicrobiota bacterium JB022]|nr:bile acid:sodium symporter family protein [Verrucomicrobiota bacterium JB022]